MVRIRVGLDLVSGWLVVMHRYLCTTFDGHCHTAVKN